MQYITLQRKDLVGNGLMILEGKIEEIWWATINLNPPGS